MEDNRLVVDVPMQELCDMTGRTERLDKVARDVSIRQAATIYSVFMSDKQREGVVVLNDALGGITVGELAQLAIKYKDGGELSEYELDRIQRIKMVEGMM